MTHVRVTFRGFLQPTRCENVQEHVQIGIHQFCRIPLCNRRRFSVSNPKLGIQIPGFAILSHTRLRENRQIHSEAENPGFPGSTRSSQKRFLYSSRRFLQLQLLRKRLLVGSHVSNLFDCAQVGVGPLIAHMITFPPVLRVGGGRRQRPPLAQHAWCISHRSKYRYPGLTFPVCGVHV